MTTIMGDLTTARADGSFPQLMASLARTDVLVLGDWVLSMLTAMEASDLLEIIDDRYNLRSTIVTSLLAVEDWHATIADPSMADVILDRLVHNAHKIALAERGIDEEADEWTEGIGRVRFMTGTPAWLGSGGQRGRAEWSISMRNQWPI